jgi:hypothetical protein
MNHRHLDWLSAWALALALVSTIAITRDLAGRVDRATDQLDPARSRGGFAYPSDPRMIVDRNEPLIDPADMAAERMAPRADEAPVRPLC